MASEEFPVWAASPGPLLINMVPSNGKRQEDVWETGEGVGPVVTVGNAWASRFGTDLNADWKSINRIPKSVPTKAMSACGLFDVNMAPPHNEKVRG
jgi:hypothetical protein